MLQHYFEEKQSETRVYWVHQESHQTAEEDHSHMHLFQTYFCHLQGGSKGKDYLGLVASNWFTKDTEQICLF